MWRIAGVICLVSGAAMAQPAAVNCFDRSGTVAAGGTAQVQAPANGYRQALWIKNPASATEPLYFSITGTATTTSIPLTPGESFTWPSGTTTYAAVSVLAATTGHVVVLMECNR